MDFKKKYTYAMVAPSSMGVRLTPIDRKNVHNSDLLTMHASSAETNVLSISSSLGLPVKVLTTFVLDSPIAKFIKNDLMRRHILYQGKEVIQEGPWGYRHQINIADSGYGLRGPRVLNDRAGEVGQTLNVKDFDLDHLFGVEGVQILHLSGLIASLSKETSMLCIALAKAAKKYGTKVSFDINYRESFWKNREEELSVVFKEIAQLTDILIGNEEDFQLALGINGPEIGGKHINDDIKSYQHLHKVVKNTFPNVILCTPTLREVITANEHLWGAILSQNEEFITTEPKLIPVRDRIGGGDGFVGGLLYGLLKGWNLEKCTHFAWATGALAVSVEEDYALPLDEEEVWSIWNGNARVKR
jgi:2-dehydro-3-deoxygluconokinase